MVQGKCVPCHTKYDWKGKPLLSKALCPKCNNPLERTDHRLKSIGKYNVSNSKRTPKERKD